ncbi:MAG: glycerophosphodiester phosphodiesterase family protein [Dehalococcoidia bacterium]
MPFTLIAHRGFSSQAPENTFEAFDLALENGFSNFELDAQPSSDGVPVVIHDGVLDRTTSGSGPVGGATLAELKALDAGSWFGDGKAYAGVKIPTLEEVLLRYADRAHIHLELKSMEPELPAKVAALLIATGWLNVADSDEFGVPGLTVTSFHIDQLHRSRRVLPPNVRHGWLLRAIDDTTLDLAGYVGVNGVYPRAATATAESVKDALSLGHSVRGWGVSGPDDIRRLVEAGAQGTTVDWPDEAARILREV